MIIQIILLILILLLPASSEAAYKIYLKNGSSITGVSSYEKKAGEYIIYFGEGSLGIPEADVLKIEQTEAPIEELSPKEIPEKEEEKGTPEEAPAPADKGAKIAALKAELDTIDSDLKALEEKEEKLRASIDEKRSEKLRWNPYQRHLLDKEIEPIQNELSSLQEKKTELLQQRAYIEGQLRMME
jgi:predicted RNase H-like nuclease (RuvC/YqgF family)